MKFHKARSGEDKVYIEPYIPLFSKGRSSIFKTRKTNQSIVDK